MRRSFRLLALSLTVAVGLSACGDKAAPTNAASAPTSNAAPSASAPAQARPVYMEGSEAQSKAVAARLKEKYPSLTVSEVRRLNTSGKVAMFEFTAGPQIAYTNEDVDFLLVGGELLAGSGAQVMNVTQQSMTLRQQTAYKTIPTEGAIEYQFGNGSREVVVFSDPDCPFCQALEYMFVQNKDNLNARVKVIPYPISSLHPQADAKSRYILCTENPTESWRSWMLEAAQGVEKGAPASWDKWASAHPSKAGCSRAGLVDQAKKYGENYGFNQTPILMFSNGMPYLGLPDRVELEKAWEFVRTGKPPVQ